MNPRTKKAMREQDELFTAERRALDVFRVVVREWRSDPASTQCFDSRLIDEAKYVDLLLTKLSLAYKMKRNGLA